MEKRNWFKDMFDNCARSGEVTSGRVPYSPDLFKSCCDPVQQQFHEKYCVIRVSLRSLKQFKLGPVREEF